MKKQLQNIIHPSTTIYDTDGQEITIDQDCDHFFKYTNYTRKVFPVSGELWIEDNGLKRTLQTFIWEVWNSFIPSGHMVILKDPESRDYRLKNLELVKIPKKEKVA